MEYQKTTNVLGNIPDTVPQFITKKWIKVQDQSDNADNRYKPSKKVRLQSDLSDYSDAYVVAKGTIAVETLDDDAYNKKLAFKK